MNELLIERIKERMAAKGMNPSSVALDAGLSRSAVRDILSGKAKNPGSFTIHAIARVLECTDNYLLGFSDEKYWREATDILIDFQGRTSDSSGTIEAGVFRQIPSQEHAHLDDDPFFFGAPLDAAPRERKPLRSKRRYVGRDLYLYAVGDFSLDRKFIVKGDLLTAVLDHSGEGMGLVDGKIIVCSHRFAGIDAEELTARIVRASRNGVSLATNSSQAKFPDIEIVGPGDKPNEYLTSKGGMVELEGIVVEVTRRLDL